MPLSNEVECINGRAGLGIAVYLGLCVYKFDGRVLVAPYVFVVIFLTIDVGQLCMFEVCLIP